MYGSPEQLDVEGDLWCASPRGISSTGVSVAVKYLFEENLVPRESEGQPSH